MLFSSKSFLNTNTSIYLIYLLTSIYFKSQYNAATLLDRNKRDHDDLEIKPHFTQTFDKSFFQPNKHLNPQREHQEATKYSSPAMVAPNLHVNKLLNMKKSHLENKQTVTQGFFDAGRLDKPSILGATTIDTGNRFATLNGASPALERKGTDPGMRVNVS